MPLGILGPTDAANASIGPSWSQDRAAARCSAP